MSVDIGVCLPYCGCGKTVAVCCVFCLPYCCCGKTVAVCCVSGYWGLSAVLRLWENSSSVLCLLSAVLLLWENSSSVLCQWILGFVCRIAVVGKQ